jgi:hypothetical protein
VRSTEWPTLTLSYRRSEILMLWTAGMLVLAGLIAAAAVVVGVPVPWRWSAALVVMLVVPGMFDRGWFQRAIRVWNGLTWRLVRVLRAYTLSVAYSVLFAAAGRSLKRTTPAGPMRGSSWTAIRRESAGDDATTESASWFAALCAFARQPGHRWTWSLVPLLVVLNLLKDDAQDTTPPGSTYTLY